MPTIADQVPMMFRAPVNGRCQLHYAQDSDIDRWADEWTAEVYPKTPAFGDTVQTQTAKISWRLLANSGIDTALIRPIIGAKGFPFYCGSSMKGVFRRACDRLFPDRTQRYCGNADRPGILRFHGGYPTTPNWSDRLVDIIHPQQPWQVETDDTTSKQGGAFVQLSLYKPELRFGISSAVDLAVSEWEEIWQIWQAALEQGLGSRVCAGYGQPETQTGPVLYQTRLQGQGIASTLLNGTPEFRPNLFRAGLRGHALRIFGGLTDAVTAKQLVDRLFGGIQNGSQYWGLLSMRFVPDSEPQISRYGYYEMPYYKVKGELSWFLTQLLPDDQQALLADLVQQLIQFAMLLGGFGKSWRRADHREFFYDDYDKLIGCHWRWLTPPVDKTQEIRRLAQVKPTIDRLRQTAIAWMASQSVTSAPDEFADWRETWHPSRVQVWGRVAEDDSDSQAIEWFHDPYIKADRKYRIRQQTIKQSSLTGQINQIGRIWHRMYPVGFGKNPCFLELLTIFPDDSPEWQKFSAFLQTKPFGFKRYW